MNLVDQLRNGTCPFTGRRYDCARCEEFRNIDRSGTGPWDMHISMDFDGYLADGKRGIKDLHRMVGGNKTCTQQECADYFWQLYHLGAETVPVGDCDNFCFRRGCMGHERLGEKELNNNAKEN